MAMHELRAESAPVTPPPADAPPMPAVAAILARLDRRRLEGFISVAIDLLDAIDGDADDEDNGDRLDGIHGGEDEWTRHVGDGGPGCPIGDSDERCGDEEASLLPVHWQDFEK